MSEKELSDGPKAEPEAHYPEIDCRSIIESCESAPDECTIFPIDSADPLGTTEWITAREWSYVPIEEMR